MTNFRYGKVVAGVKEKTIEQETIQVGSWRNYPNWMMMLHRMLTGIKLRGSEGLLESEVLKKLFNSYLL